MKLNALSGVVTAVGVLGIVYTLTTRWSMGVRVVSVFVAAAVLLGVFAVLRSNNDANFGTKDLDRALASGQPVALEFFSNF